MLKNRVCPPDNEVLEVIDETAKTANTAEFLVADVLIEFQIKAWTFD